eukprot:526608_1
MGDKNHKIQLWVIFAMLSQYTFSMGVIEKSFDQRLDHFNAYNADKTFKQRWYYNDTFWSGVSGLGPIIYQVGGESTNDGNNTIYGFVESIAPKINGLVVSAEHRFYGESMPFTPENTNYITNSNHLGVLTLEQAMADYMELLYFLKNTYFRCTDCPVIVLGGSYSGKLSFYLRLKYPYLFDMALAASAPIFMDSDGMVNPNAFYEIVTNATRRISSKCVDYIQSAFNVLMFESTSAQITETLPLCSPLPKQKDAGLNELLAMIYQQFANYAMGNYPPTTSPLKAACKRIENGSVDDGLWIWNRFLFPEQTEQGCINLAQYLPQGAHATIRCSDLSGCGSGYNGESWDYQACTEVIQPIGTNNITDMFPVFPFNMSWMDEHCMARFGVKASNGRLWLEKEFGLNSAYFYDKLKDITSHVLFSNGLQDGWSAGGNHRNLSDTLIAIDMPNGAHHVDLRADDPDDTRDVIDARAQETTLLTQWVKDFHNKRMT